MGGGGETRSPATGVSTREGAQPSCEYCCAVPIAPGRYVFRGLPGIPQVATKSEGLPHILRARGVLGQDATGGSPATDGGRAVRGVGRGWGVRGT